MSAYPGSWEKGVFQERERDQQCQLLMQGQGGKDKKSTTGFVSQEVLGDCYKNSFQERWGGSQTGINWKLGVLSKDINCEPLLQEIWL